VILNFFLNKLINKLSKLKHLSQHVSNFATSLFALSFKIHIFLLPSFLFPLTFLAVTAVEILLRKNLFFVVFKKRPKEALLKSEQKKVFEKKIETDGANSF